MATTSEPPLLQLRLIWSSMARATFKVADPLDPDIFSEQFNNFWKQEETEAMDSATQ